MNADFETTKLLFEAVKVMIPLLTAFLTIYASGIGKLWEKLDSVFDRIDFFWVCTISTFAILTLGCWALTLAGAIVSTSGGQGVTIPFSGKEALLAARVSMGIGYWLFVCLLISAGWYFLKLSIQLRPKSSTNQDR